ncbi:hypothetical protein BDV96DRAFT_615664 [Lophiotrema nucula]|uniref:Uncharacterized protein n=1 Tax=Lophiotrema nucula TaxID=690887 RepID=A0A6A5YU78_9PLEO|nr:hypothetical protein BDV96DRAFT_615664 [Lophiotrema nucula]
MHNSAKSKTWETSVTRIESWPEEAMPLKTYTWMSYLYLVGDVILALLPLFFILLGAAVVSLNRRPTKNNDFGSKVEFAIQLSPTLFPIVFAAIVGRSLKMIARYHAERGAKLSTLELLMASQSVWGTVESQLLLQRLTIVGANLLFLWALSPLGGQASLRLMSRDMAPTYSPTKLRYMTTGPAATAFALGSSYAGNGKLGDAAALYTAALLAPQATKLGPMDIWGNLKLPSLESLNGTAADSAGWISVPSNITEPEMFSSLVGLPVVGLPHEGASTFNVESSYISLSCGAFARIDSPDFSNPNDTRWNAFDNIALGTNASIASSDRTRLRPSASGPVSSLFVVAINTLYPGWDALETARIDAFIGYYNQTFLSNMTLSGRKEIIYASRGKFALNVVKCSLEQKHIEAVIQCHGTQCSTSHIRKSLTDNRPAVFTGFDHGMIRSQFAQEFPTIAPQSDGSNPTDRFLADTSTLPLIQQVGYAGDGIRLVELSAVPPELFSRRLSLLWNTYYQVSIQPTGYLGNLPANLSLYGPDTIPVTDLNAWLPSNLSATNHSITEWWFPFENTIQSATSPFIGASTIANVTANEEIFACNFAWLALLWGASGIIFFTGVISLVLKHRTLGPELFGFVTSMTYHNPYIRVPAGGSRLDAMERARLLRDVEVYIADVCGDDDVGHVALAAGVPARKLEKDRLYH